MKDVGFILMSSKTRYYEHIYTDAKAIKAHMWWCSLNVWAKIAVYEMYHPKKPGLSNKQKKPNDGGGIAKT